MKKYLLILLLGGFSLTQTVDEWEVDPYAMQHARDQCYRDKEAQLKRLNDLKTSFLSFRDNKFTFENMEKAERIGKEAFHELEWLEENKRQVDMFIEEIRKYFAVNKDEMERVLEEDSKNLHR